MPTLTVNTLADQSDGSSVGGLSLRDAILTANADSNNDYIINLQAGSTYLLSAGDADEDLGVGGDLDITNSNITVRTAGRQPATIDAGGLQFSDRVFHVLASGNLTLENVILTRGNTESGGGLRVEEEGTASLVSSTVSGNTAEDGGGGISNAGTTTLIESNVNNNSVTAINSSGAGIRSSGTLTLNDSTVSDNTTPSSFSSGGGISIAGGTSTADLTRSSVSNNSSSYGGGISSSGVVTLTNSTVSGNSATSRGGGIGSGGINTGVLNLVDSTISGNTAGFEGGGIFARNILNSLDSTISNNSTERPGGGVYTRGTATFTNTTISGNSGSEGGGISSDGSFNNTAILTNSTISGNSATGDGGGIFNGNGTATITNSTITNNTTNTDRNTTGNGGGVFNSGTLTLRNSIVAENIDLPSNAGTGDSHRDLSGAISGNNSNLIGTTEGATGNVGTGSDIVAPNPLLGPLADNGGPTLTHAPLEGSPAINGGNNALIAPDTLDIDADNNFTEPVPSDQRRRQRIAGPSVDIGAVEDGAAPLPPNFIARTGSSNLLTPVQTLSSPVPTFADLDGDGDLDATVGDINGGLLYFRNDTDRFTRTVPARNPFANIDVGFVSTPTFVDIDGDLDQDLFVGAFDGTINYYRNNNGRFVEQTGNANPFNGVDVGSYSNIAFANVDGDNDVDAFLGLADGRVSYYRNNNGRFTLVSGAGNPLNGIDAGQFSFPSFGDVDGDGDVDAVLGEVFGRLRYYRNDGGRFRQTAGTNNPFERVDVGFYSAPSFADVDGDGDVDGIIGGDISLEGNSRGRLSFIENTLPVGTPTAQRAADVPTVVNAKLEVDEPLLAGSKTFSQLSSSADGFEELSWSAESNAVIGITQEQVDMKVLGEAALTGVEQTIL